MSRLLTHAGCGRGGEMTRDDVVNEANEIAQGLQRGRKSSQSVAGHSQSVSKVSGSVWAFDVAPGGFLEKNLEESAKFNQKKRSFVLGNGSSM